MELTLYQLSYPTVKGLAAYLTVPWRILQVYS